ncbi:hypothetical protein BV25DRAFT_348467 [Artomyces pyxidatus]|uniref:Uncharacterized protein n=1 Tax=Artomyces pyxidatus TaxID=48021 RepID=A0ACB8T7N2_9AGAM|nr:hypothetical protein BV25DRAFT_348467 [Artomyces pyxidatus]
MRTGKQLRPTPKQATKNYCQDPHDLRRLHRALHSQFGVCVTRHLLAARYASIARNPCPPSPRAPRRRERDQPPATVVWLDAQHIRSTGRTSTGSPKTHCLRRQFAEQRHQTRPQLGPINFFRFLYQGGDSDSSRRDRFGELESKPAVRGTTLHNASSGNALSLR